MNGGVGVTWLLGGRWPVAGGTLAAGPRFGCGPCRLRCAGFCCAGPFGQLLADLGCEVEVAPAVDGLLVEAGGPQLSPL